MRVVLCVRDFGAAFILPRAVVDEDEACQFTMQNCLGICSA